MQPNEYQEQAIKLSQGDQEAEGVCNKCGERCPHCNPKKGENEEAEKDDEKFDENDSTLEE